jgi:S1-C subfamily serine protease
VDLLDWIIVLLVVAAAIHGLRLGAAVQVLSFAGMLVGLVAGVLLVSAVTPHLHGQFTRSFLSLFFLLLPCGLLWATGRQIGARLWGRMQGHALARLDALAGAVIAMAGTLVFVWLLASVMVNSQVATISSEIENSSIIRGVANVMPQIPSQLASVEHLLGQDGFPIGIIQPGSVKPVELPSSAKVAAAVRVGGASVVRVVSYGCDHGDIVEKGTGFVVAPSLVVTNAHVVAGGSQIVVGDETGDHNAIPVYFNPEYDLAVLKVPGLADRALRLDPHYVGRGTDAAVLGYPGGGPFNAQPAGVLALLDAEGMDIYNNRTTVREIYEIQAVVRQGNSGSPLIEPDGRVVGVVFSRATDNNHIGYALASPGVLSRVRKAEAQAAFGRVSTGSCTSG